MADELKICLRGHPYTLENTIYLRNGKTTCRECNRMSKKRSEEKLRAVNWQLRHEANKVTK